MNIAKAILSGGGPVDGFPTTVNPSQDEVYVPYTDEMLNLISLPITDEQSKNKWLSFHPPSADDSKAVAVYKKSTTPSPEENWIGVPDLKFEFDRTITPEEFRQIQRQ